MRKDRSKMNVEVLRIDYCLVYEYYYVVRSVISEGGDLGNIFKDEKG